MSRVTEASGLLNSAPPAPRRPVRLLSHSFINSVFLAAVAVVLVTLDMSNESRVRSLEKRVESLEATIDSSASRADALQHIIDSLLATDSDAKARELALSQRVDAATDEMQRTVQYVHGRLDNMTTNTDLQHDVQALRTDMQSTQAYVLQSLDAKEGEINANMQQARENFEQVLNETVQSSAREMEAYKQSFRDYGDALKTSLDAGFQQQKDELSRFHEEVTSLETGLDEYRTTTDAQFKHAPRLRPHEPLQQAGDPAEDPGHPVDGAHLRRHQLAQPGGGQLRAAGRAAVAGADSGLLRGLLHLHVLGADGLDPGRGRCAEMHQGAAAAPGHALHLLHPELHPPVRAHAGVGALLPVAVPGGRDPVRRAQAAAVAGPLQPGPLHAAHAAGVVRHLQLRAVHHDPFEPQRRDRLLRPHLLLPRDAEAVGAVPALAENMTINVLLYIGYSGITNEMVAENIQNFLICVEMFIAATMHTYTFGYQEWQPGYVPPTNVADMSDNFAARDFLRDFRWVLKPGGNAVLTPTPERRPRTGGLEDEATPLLLQMERREDDLGEGGRELDGAAAAEGDEESLNVLSLADQPTGAAADPRSLSLRPPGSDGKTEEPEEEQKAQTPLGLMP
eukprot:scaffold298_cov247-Pinguiococcus_pyrenoidosus.AAC.10